jgi:hypothetical protein
MKTSRGCRRYKIGAKRRVKVNMGEESRKNSGIIDEWKV